MISKTPKSPRFPLEWCVNKALILLDKEGIHAVVPDIMAQHLGYKNARSGAAATALGTLRMFGLVIKAPGRKDAVSEELKKFKYTPYEHEKSELVDGWLRKPKLFSIILDKYNNKLPSEAALRYELIQEFGFTENAADKFLKTLNDSISFAGSFEAEDPEGSGPESTDEKLVEQMASGAGASAQPQVSNTALDLTVSEDQQYVIQITGPGMNTQIEINEEDDLLVVDAILKKVRKGVTEVS